MSYIEKINAYCVARDYYHKALNELKETSDGFLYVTRLRCYGSLTTDTHNNAFTVQELCDEFNGENGIVDVYTNNPNHGIETYGSVIIVPDEELKDHLEGSISASQAVCNWIARM